jgi:hypothetical protein
LPIASVDHQSNACISERLSAAFTQTLTRCANDRLATAYPEIHTCLIGPTVESHYK